MKRTALNIWLLAWLGATLATAQTFNTPIRHVIIIVQENRTPDNLFQDPNLINNGADIKTASDGAAVPLGVCWDPGHGHGSWNTDYGLQHTGSFCPSNSYVPAGCSKPACPQDTYVENTPSDPTIQPYWSIAENYGFANYMFQTNEGPSFPAHQFLFSGTSQPDAYNDTYYNYFASENEANNQNNQVGCAAAETSQVEDINSSGVEGFDYTPPEPISLLGYPCYEHKTLSDLLEGARVSWKYYGPDPNEANNIWTAPNAIQHICGGTPGGSCSGTDFTTHVDLTDTDVFSDVIKCNLAGVSWVIPDGHYSDHPGHQFTPTNGGGPDWVADIVDAVGINPKCPNGETYWNDTAILITWDDWGGFYDHVPPYERLIDTDNNCNVFGCGYVSGFRVPLLVVSAYTSKGYVSGPCQNGSCNNYKPPYWHDAGSVLNFTEYVFGLAQGQISQTPPWFFDDYWAPDNYLSGKCSQQICPYGLSDFFNFGQQPNPFTFIQPITYKSAQDFINLVGGQPEDPDLETP